MYRTIIHLEEDLILLPSYYNLMSFTISQVNPLISLKKRGVLANQRRVFQSHDL